LRHEVTLTRLSSSRNDHHNRTHVTTADACALTVSGLGPILIILHKIDLVKSLISKLYRWDMLIMCAFRRNDSYFNNYRLVIFLL